MTAAEAKQVADDHNDQDKKRCDKVYEAIQSCAERGYYEITVPYNYVDNVYVRRKLMDDKFELLHTEKGLKISWN